MATITFELPDDVERHLAALAGSADALAKEAALVELYRQGQISHGALAKSLGISRNDADAVLGRHGVTEDLPSIDEVQADLQALRARLRP